MTTEFAAVLGRVVAALDIANVPFMIAGSFASTMHGMPRATQDLDVVIDPVDAKAVEALVKRFPLTEFYIDAMTAQEAFRSRSMFNVIDHTSGWKVDFIVKKDRPFSREEFARRTATSFLGVAVYVASAEDTIVSKLEWSRLAGGSERQRRDIAGILAAQGDRIDAAYLVHWIEALDLTDEWTKAQSASL